VSSSTTYLAIEGVLQGMYLSPPFSLVIRSTTYLAIERVLQGMYLSPPFSLVSSSSTYLAIEGVLQGMYLSPPFSLVSSSSTCSSSLSSVSLPAVIDIFYLKGYYRKISLRFSSLKELSSEF
jgi:hypothetical protein